MGLLISRQTILKKSTLNPEIRRGYTAFKNTLQLVLPLTLLLVLQLPLDAAVVLLNNGDVLSGTFQKTPDFLALKSPVGEFKIPHSDIKRLIEDETTLPQKKIEIDGQNITARHITTTGENFVYLLPDGKVLKLPRPSQPAFGPHLLRAYYRTGFLGPARPVLQAGQPPSFKWGRSELPFSPGVGLAYSYALLPWLRTGIQAEYMHISDDSVPAVSPPATSVSMSHNLFSGALEVQLAPLAAFAGSDGLWTDLWYLSASLGGRSYSSQFTLSMTPPNEPPVDIDLTGNQQGLYTRLATGLQLFSGHLLFFIEGGYEWDFSSQLYESYTTTGNADGPLEQSLDALLGRDAPAARAFTLSAGAGYRF